MSTTKQDKAEHDKAEQSAEAHDAAGGEHSHHGYIPEKEKFIRRLKLIEGQARGLQRMVDDEVYCIDILTQVSAMTKALESVGLGLLHAHMDHCVVEAARESDDAAAAKVDEAMKAITRLVKS